MIADGKKMDVQLDVSKASRVSRLEVIEGPTGRRNRSAAEKAPESLVPGAEVATVARKHGVTRWQVYDWRRRLARAAVTA
jgi:transposase